MTRHRDSLPLPPVMPTVVPLGDRDAPSGGPTPEDVAAAREMKEGLERALQTLPPREEKVLRMRFGVGDVDDTAPLGEQGEGFPAAQARLGMIEARTVDRARSPHRK